MLNLNNKAHAPLPENRQGDMPFPLMGLNDIVSLKIEKRRLWVMVYLLVFTNALTGYALFSTFPLKEHVPYFLTINEYGEQLYYKVKPTTALTTDQLKQVARDYIKAFVVDANTIDNHPHNIKERLRRLKATATPQVFGYIFESQAKWNELNEGNRRTAKILSDEFSTVEPNRIQVLFEVTDITPPDTGAPEGKEYKAKYKADIRFGVSGYTINTSDMDNNPNPLGLSIVSYDLLKIEAEQPAAAPATALPAAQNPGQVNPVLPPPTIPEAN